MPCRWINGWPMLGDENGKVPEQVRPMVSGEPETSIVKSDDFEGKTLGLHWQWNHNPVNTAWSLSERPGHLRLKTSRIVNNLYLAPNTLTQRMEGACVQRCHLTRHLKDEGWRLRRTCRLQQRHRRPDRQEARQETGAGDERTDGGTQRTRQGGDWLRGKSHRKHPPPQNPSRLRTPSSLL